MEVENTLANSYHRTVNPNSEPVELELSNFLYEAIDVSSFVDTKKWSQYFNQIPVDPYIKEGYRFKAIAWFRVKHDRSAAIDGIDEHIRRVNELSGMREEQIEKYVSTSEPT